MYTVHEPAHCAHWNRREVLQDGMLTGGDVGETGNDIVIM